MIRLALGEMPTRDYLDEVLDRMEREIDAMRERAEWHHQADQSAVEE